MKQWKKLLAVGMSAMMAVGVLAGCGGSDKKAEDSTGAKAEGGSYELVVGHINAEEHTWHKMAEKFKEVVEEKSNGQVTVKIYPNSSLGSEIDMIQSAIAGTGDCDIVFTGESMQTYAEELGIIGMPYAITSDEHMTAVLEGEAGKELDDIMLKAGLRNLGAVTRGPRNITSNKEIKTPEDLKGFVIRTPESPMTMAAFEAMGAKPTPMAFNEIFTSLQQGVIDGQENPLANINDAALYEVQDYVIKTEHLRAWVYFAISESRFSSFPEDIQKVIADSAAEAVAYEHELFLEQEASLEKDLTDKGMTFVEVDQTPFKEKAVSGVLSVLTDKQKAIYDKIVAADPANK